MQHKADPDSPEGLAHRRFLLERERERLVALKASSERDRNNAFKMIVLAVLAVSASAQRTVGYYASGTHGCSTDNVGGYAGAT